jgi:hypothetical protein
MNPPFTRDQFFDLSADSNEALWLAAVALWIASGAIVALRLSAHRPHDRSVSALLAVPWAVGAKREFFEEPRWAATLVPTAPNVSCHPASSRREPKCELTAVSLW